MSLLSLPSVGENTSSIARDHKDRNRPESLAEVASRLNDELRHHDLLARLALIRAAIPGRLVFTTSFGVEDQAISHAIFSQGLGIDVVTLDTGRLFPETHEVWAATERRYGVRVVTYLPAQKQVEALLAEQGIDGFRTSVTARHACCEVRKVIPLGRALAKAKGWVTGLRADQSGDRSQAKSATYDRRRKLAKVNPLIDWRREDVVAFVRAHDVPYNALHDRGFVSIGCAPCTRAVEEGEPERAGRWWWEQETAKECGLHFTAEGRVVRRKVASLETHNLK
jgi:phosphoadenosine phosphosulfate reductase